MKDKLNSVKKFVEQHKVTIAVVATASTGLYLNRIALKQHNDFLKEKGLYEEFYTENEE